MRKLEKYSRGFTLLELMVAISLLAIGLLAAVSMQEVAIKSNDIANRLSTGAALAQQASEEVLSNVITNPIFTTAGASQYLFIDANNPPTTTPTVTGAGAYTASYTVTPKVPILGIPTPEVSQIVITVNDAATNQTLGTLTTYKRTPR